MRKLKKFKRFSQGGLGSSEGEGDPFANKTEFDPERRERAIEGIKDFFMGRRPRGEASAPIEERDTSRKAPEPVKAEPVKAEPAKTKPAVTSSVPTPSVAQQMADREKGGPNERANYASVGKTSRPDYDSYHYGPDYMQGGDEGVDSRTFKHRDPKKAEEYRQSLMPGNKPKPAAGSSASSGVRPAKITQDSETGKSRGRKEEGPPVFSTPSRRARPEDIPGTDVIPGPEGEKIDNSGQFAQSAMAAFPALSGAGAAVRGAVRGAGMLNRMLESAPKAEGKGTGKFPEDKPEIEVLRTPAVVRAKPKSTEPKPMTEAEKMGLRETNAMRDARIAKEKFEAAGKGAKDAADEVAAEAAKRAASKRQTPDNRRFPNKGSATPGRPKTRAEIKATGNKFNRPVGEKRGPKTDEVLEREGLSAKKGGKIPAFKKGGMVGSASRRADGCATKGKTRGRMM